MKNHFTTAAALLLAMSVTAQSQPENKDSLGLFYQLQEIKVTGVKQAPHSINKVDAKQIKHYNKPNVTEALNLLPGLAITEMGARNEGSITLRGFAVPLSSTTVSLSTPLTTAISTSTASRLTM